MDNQHKKIKGYRDLSQKEIDLMNEIKIVGEHVRVLCEKVDDHPNRDGRWCAIATTDLQKGFMALVRAVAKPESF